MKAGYSNLLEYLEYLQSRGRYNVIRAEAINELQLSENAFKKAACRLIKKGKLRRIRGGFYTVIPPEYSGLGSLPASWFIDSLMKYLRMPYYCGLLTAASLLGVAHQQPMLFQVVTAKPVRPIQVGNVQIEFLNKKKILDYFFQPVKTVTGYMNVGSPEITAFDLVRYMRVSGHVNHVSTVLLELAEKLDTEKLAYLIEKGDVEIASAQRLGYLLEILSVPLDLGVIEKALKFKEATQRLLITGVDQPILEHNRRWNILVNEQVEPDDI